jgi:hypothetical protein
MAEKKYKVAEGRIASSSKDGKDYGSGESIDLSHLNAEQIQNLINIGLVVEDTGKPAAKNEVNNG